MSDVKTIGKGTVYLTASNFVFYLSSALLYFVLGRILGPEKFGIYGLIISLATMVNVTISAGINQAVSKFTSEEPNNSNAAKRIAFLLQFIVGFFSFLLIFLLAKFIAQLLNDITLVNFIRIASTMFIFYPLYSVFMGYINGTKRFKAQAIFNGIYAILKLTLVIGAVLLGFSIFGAISGFVLASFIVFLIAFIFLGLKKEGNTSFKKIINFALPITIFNITINLLLNMSIILIKALSDKSVANLLTGYYTAAFSISNIPYASIVAFTFVLFPIISESSFRRKMKETQKYIRASLRYSLIILFPLIFLISSTSKELISLIYTAKFLDASPILTILIFGMGFYAVYFILSTIISGSGNPRVVMLIGFPLILLSVVLNYFFIIKNGAVGAALATTIVMGLGMLISAAYIRLRFGVLMRLKSFTRILFAGLVIYFLSKIFFFPNIYLVLKYGILGIIYLTVLIITKEFKKVDFIFVRKAIFK